MDNKQMTAVRFTQDQSGALREHQEGEWVGFEAYASLLSENNRLKEEAKELARALGNITQYLYTTDELGEEFLTPMARKHYEEAEQVLQAYLRIQTRSSI